jgi:chaperonin GroES
MGIYQEEYLKENSSIEEGYKPKKANIELLKKYAQEVDISYKLDEQFLYQLGNDLIKQVSADDDTRNEWMTKYNQALDIARQKMDVKEYPFDNASNVKIPLILQGCVQFNARIMPEVIQNNKTVYASITGTPSIEDEASAQRLSEHMSLQTMKIVENWVSDTDKMLIVLPLVGTVFRKWTYDPIARKPCSFLCLPTEIIISNDVSSVEKAERVTHVMRMSRNEIIERIRFGIFNEDCLNDLSVKDDVDSKIGDINYSSGDEEKELPSDTVESRDNYIMWEVACFIDLDDDGYCEPYTVTIVRKTKRIARIAARFDERDLVLNSAGDLVRINPSIYYIAHHFLPSPDGTFLGMGFGQMLLQLNEAINTITNQLIDAGTLANMQGGFVSKDLRLRKGDLQFSAGEWKMVNFNVGMGNLSNHIYPLPFKEPSQTLMALLNFLVDFGRQSANISEILMGNPAAANMPATSVVSLIEQGSKVFSSILTRLYESLRKEFNILFNINKKYLSLYPQSDLMTDSGFITVKDYTNEKFNIYPVANPAMGMDAVRLAKMQVLMQMQTPLLNQVEILKRYLITLGIPNPEKLIVPPQPPQPDPLVVAQVGELNARAQEIAMRSAKIMRDGDLEAIKLELEERRIQVDAANKGGQLAIGKANAVAAITTAESRAAGNQSAEAEKIVDKEVSKTGINVDFTGIDQQLLGNMLQNSQNNASLSQNTQQAPQGEPQQAPQGGTGTQNAPNLPPELDQMLQQVAASQQKK